MPRGINDSVVTKVREYIRNSPDYKLVDFVKKFVTTEVDDSGGNPKIKCPFHGKDNTPSCFIRLDVNGFKCFACDAGGDYVEFRRRFEKISKNIDFNYYSMMDKILVEDPKMKLDVGTHTIYVDKELTLDEVINKPIPSFKPRGERKLESLMELSGWMKKTNHSDYDSIVVAIISAQQGLIPEEVKSVVLGEIRNDIILPDMSGIDLDDLLLDFKVEM